jgi:tRNA A58 N-methylase Trm61
MVSIEDNFLEDNDFKNLQSYLLSENCHWHWADFIDYIDKKSDTFQFTHLFYEVPRSMNFIEELWPIIQKIQPVSVYRIKANLLTKTPNIVENSFHRDIADLEVSPEKMKQWTTSIFYVNTNNGYTKFETAEVIESVENRMVTFPSNIRHTGTSCTDEKVRVVINFNYFSRT